MKSWAVFCVLVSFGCATASVPINSGTGSSQTTGMSTSGPTTGGSGGSGGNIPTGPWVNVTSNLANMESVCGTLAYVSAKADEDVMIAGVNLKGLWKSSDDGATWEGLGTGAGSAMIDNRVSSIVYDPAKPSRYWQTGIYDGHGVFVTEDDGATFAQLGDIRHVDLVGIDFSDPDRKFMLAGGHEQVQTLYRSTDGGTNWSSVGPQLPPNLACTFPLVIDATTQLVGCGGPFGGGGILRSTDGASSWTQVSTSGGASAPLRASDGTIYWAGPVGKGMARSTDGGVTWTEGQVNAVSVSRPIELPDGRVATIANGSIVLSADRGETWKPIVVLPYGDAQGLAYSAYRKAMFVWRQDCGNGPVQVAPNSMMRFDFDYESM